MSSKKCQISPRQNDFDTENIIQKSSLDPRRITTNSNMPCIYKLKSSVIKARIRAAQADLNRQLASRPASFEEWDLSNLFRTKYRIDSIGKHDSIKYPDDLHSILAGATSLDLGNFPATTERGLISKRWRQALDNIMDTRQAVAYLDRYVGTRNGTFDSNKPQLKDTIMGKQLRLLALKRQLATLGFTSGKVYSKRNNISDPEKKETSLRKFNEKNVRKRNKHFSI